MASCLWFVTDGVGIIDVFKDESSAEEKVEMYQDDPDYEYYGFYSIKFSEIKDYPEEYDFAHDRGFLD